MHGDRRPELNAVARLEHTVGHRATRVPASATARSECCRRARGRLGGDTGGNQVLKVWRDQHAGHCARRHPQPATPIPSPARALAQIINAPSTDAVLGLVVDNFQTLNGVNVATAMHNVAKLTKFKRAERDALLRDPRYLQLLDGTVERVSECNARAVADILWSCGTLGELPPTLLKPVLTQASRTAVAVDVAVVGTCGCSSGCSRGRSLGCSRGCSRGRSRGGSSGCSSGCSRGCPNGRNLRRPTVAASALPVSGGGVPGAGHF